MVFPMASASLPNNCPASAEDITAQYLPLYHGTISAAVEIGFCKRLSGQKLKVKHFKEIRVGAQTLGVCHALSVGQLNKKAAVGGGCYRAVFPEWVEPFLYKILGYIIYCPPK